MVDQGFTKDMIVQIREVTESNVTPVRRIWFHQSLLLSIVYNFRIQSKNWTRTVTNTAYGIQRKFVDTIIESVVTPEDASLFINHALLGRAKNAPPSDKFYSLGDIVSLSIHIILPYRLTAFVKAFALSDITYNQQGVKYTIKRGTQVNVISGPSTKIVSQ
jgi:hypothetical protein